MTKSYPDDRRYMSFEQRAAEGDERFVIKEKPASEKPVPYEALEAKRAAYEARKAGDTEAYERALETVLWYRKRGYRV